MGKIPKKRPLILYLAFGILLMIMKLLSVFALGKAERNGAMTYDFS
jgi:hypothetical protein